MLLNTAHFEQHFSESTLKSALRLLAKGPVEIIERHGKSDYRLALGGHEIRLKLRGEKLLSSECSCTGMRMCEHLAASLFHLNKEKFGQEELAGIKHKAAKARINLLPVKKMSANEVALVLDSKPKAKGLRKRLDTLPGEAALQNYMILLKRLIYEPGEKNKTLITDPLNVINKFILNFEPSTYAQLALVVTLQEIHSPVLMEKMKHVELGAMENLSNKTEVLKAPEKKAWEVAALLCMRNSRVFKGGVWKQLVPPMLCWLRQRQVFSELRLLFLKRKNERRFYEKIDWFMVVKLEVDIQESNVFLSETPAREANTELEYLLAETELAFNQGKLTKAFARLKMAYTHVCEHRRECFEELTSYGLIRTTVYGNIKLKRFFMEERITKSLFVSEEQLNAWKDMLPARERKKAYERLIAKLREPAYYSFEKLSMVLLSAGKIKELIQEIKKNEQTFLLLHEVAVKYMPRPDKEFLLLYANRLALALARLRLYSGQTELFNMAAAYLIKLPASSIEIVANTTTMQLGSESNIAKYILQSCAGWY